jgi:hypothetical protein
VDAREEFAYLELHARQGGMKVGRSILGNMFGQSAMFKCEFEALCRYAGKEMVIMSTDFLISASDRSIEALSGVSRELAEKKLRLLHEEILRDGWRSIESGPHWYSYRYRMAHDEFMALVERSG